MLRAPSRPLRFGARRAFAAAALCTVAALAPAGCGKQEDEELPVACEAPAEVIVDALAAAPAAVVVRGERISACVDRAITGGEIQRIGSGLTGAGDELARAAPDDPRAALELGYLVGAVRRGRSANGIHDELTRRITDAVPRAAFGRAAQAAYRRGLAAGREGG